MPQLVHATGLVPELVGGRHHDIRWAGHQVVVQALLYWDGQRVAVALLHELNAVVEALVHKVHSILTRRLA